MGRTPKAVDPRFGVTPAVSNGRVDRRASVHRLHEMHSGMPRRRDRRRFQIHAHSDRGRVHRMRVVHSAVPGRLHRDAAREPGGSRPGPSPALREQRSPWRRDAWLKRRGCAVDCGSMLTSSAPRAHPLRTASPAEHLALPLDQHAGAPATPSVQPGDRVLLGQPIAEPGGAISAWLHSPVSGTVTAIDRGPHLIMPALLRSASSSRTTDETSVSTRRPPCQLRTAVAAGAA